MEGPVIWLFNPRVGDEIAFVGRSNGGKSSLLNAIAGTSIVAKVSDKPGETRSVNFYKIGNGKRVPTLVDLPGYGFAFSKEETQEEWTRVMERYVESRANLSSVCVLVDSRQVRAKISPRCAVRHAYANARIRTCRA